MGDRSDASRRVITLAGMTLANAMILVDQTAVPLALPDLMNELEVAPSSAQWVLTANVLALAGFLVFGGRLGDIIGRRRIFVIGTIVFVTGSALAGASPNIASLVAARAIQGFGAALMMPATIAIVSATFPSSQRGRALGIMGGVAAIFAALGPAIGGALTSIDWRFVFYVNVPIAGVTLLTVLVIPRLAPHGPRVPIDWPGTALLSAGLVTIILGLTQIQPWGLGPATIALIAASPICFVAFLYAERRVAAPLIDVRNFRHRNYLGASLSQVIGGYSELGFGVILPLVLILNLKLSPWEAGLALIPGTLPMIVVAPLAGRWYDRAGGRPPLVAGFLALALSGFVLALVVGQESLSLLIVGLVIQGVGLSLVLTVNDPTGIDSIPDAEQGQASGVIDTAEQVGGALGIATLYTMFHLVYMTSLDHRLRDAGISIPESDFEAFRAHMTASESTGLDPSGFSGNALVILEKAEPASTLGYAAVFAFAGLLALVGVVVMWALVRRPPAEPATGPEAPHASHGTRWGRFSIMGSATRVVRRRADGERLHDRQREADETDAPAVGHGTT